MALLGHPLLVLVCNASKSDVRLYTKASLLTPLCLQTFYASIIVENADFITSDGEPT